MSLPQHIQLLWSHFQIFDSFLIELTATPKNVSMPTMNFSIPGNEIFWHLFNKDICRCVLDEINLTLISMTQQEYAEATSIGNLAAFVRSLIGLNQETVNEKFGKYLNGNLLNSRHQEFVRTIINYVRENSDV